MKISLLTLHSQNNNFGSVLQAYSLYSYLQESGHDVTVLNYRPYYSNGAVNIKMLFKKTITNVMFLQNYIKRSKKFNEILNREKTTVKYNSYEQLKNAYLKYDLYMIGSDQVWNPNYLCGKDQAYTFQFVTGKNKMSYAASIGTSELSEEQFCKIVDNIKDFTYASLRENASAVAMQKAGRKDAEYVLDPVFLHDKAYYRQMGEKPQMKGYILAYIIHKDPFIAEVVSTVAKKLNKKVVQIGGFASKCDYDFFDRSAGPRDFLGLIDNADLVITSSFHGLAFSHIFEKQFLVVMPHNNTLRLENILESFGTSCRVVKSINDIDDILSKKTDYQAVNEKINALRDKSCRFLNKALRDFTEGKL